MPLLDKRIGFLGAGKMATALARGWIEAGLTAPAHILASDPAAEARSDFSHLTGAPATTSNREVAARSEIVLLAVKPQTMAAVLAEIRPDIQPRHLVISIAAGISLRFSLGSLPVVEYFFDWPGMGSRLLDAIRAGETNLVVTLALALGLTFLAVNLLLDIAYRIIDPRIRD